MAVLEKSISMKYLIPYRRRRHQNGTADSDEDDVCQNDFLIEDSPALNNEELSANCSNIPQKKTEECQINETCTSDLLESHKV